MTASIPSWAFSPLCILLEKSSTGQNSCTSTQHTPPAPPLTRAATPLACASRHLPPGPLQAVVPAFTQSLRLEIKHNLPFTPRCHLPIALQRAATSECHLHLKNCDWSLTGIFALFNLNPLDPTLYPTACGRAELR